MKISLDFKYLINEAVSEFRNGFLFLILSLLFVCTSSNLIAQKPNELIYQKDSLKKDLLDLKQTLYSSHENLFYYTDSIEFEARFKETYNSIDEDISLYEFAKRTNLFLQTLKDSHTGVSTSSLFSYLKADTALILPFRTTLIHDQVIIFNDKQDRIPDGAVLISISGIPTDTLLKETKYFLLMEGNSINQSHTLAASLITRVFDLTSGIKEKNNIAYEHLGDTITIAYKSSTYKELKKKREKYEPLKLIIEDSIAYLQIGSFNYKTDAHFERFLKKSFKKIKRTSTKKLVIDLRNNLGGRVWRMEKLFTFLEGPDVLVPYSLIHLKSELSSKKYYKLSKGLLGWVRLNFYRNNDKMRVFRETAALSIGQKDTLIYKDYSPKSKLAFNGDKALLMNQSSASASVLFSSKFIENSYGIVLGTPCLGPKGGTWGDPTPYTLKRSKLRLYISVLRLSTSEGFDSSPQSIQPDVLFPVNREHISNNEDDLIEFLKNNLHLAFP